MDNNKEDVIEFPITPNYSPLVTVEIVGALQNKPVVAVVDTGFEGFLQVPMGVGVSANLRLWGTGRSKLADGSIVKNLQCFGSIKFASRELFGLISLSETGEDCLLGMQFLSEVQGEFTVSHNSRKAIFKLPKVKAKEILPDPLTPVQPSEQPRDEQQGESKDSEVSLTLTKVRGRPKKIVS